MRSVNRVYTYQLSKAYPNYHQNTGVY